MKLSTLFAKLTCMKSQVVRTVAAVVFAGAAFTAAAPAASAQRAAFGMQFGAPRYVAPAQSPLAYGAPGPRYDDWREHGAWERQEEWRRHEAWRRHEEWLRYHREPYGYDSRSFGYRPY